MPSSLQPTLSAIICTHNPRRDYLQRVLTALQQQTLPLEQWEFLVIDNASSTLLAPELDLSWHPTSKVVRETQLGLTHARLRGFREATAPLLVYIDDDNLLCPDYLQAVVTILGQEPRLGAIGGKSLPEFERQPEPWIREFDTILALRDFGELTLRVFGPDINTYPAFAPAGAGMALRRSALAIYEEQITSQPQRLRFGRQGQQLTSGEDNDMVLTLLAAGWGVGYFPQLQLTHLIPARRLQRDYLARLNYAASQSWVQVLDLHGQRLWPRIPRWTVGLRQLKAWYRYQPWRNRAAYVHWRGACGLLTGQSSLS